MFVNMTIASLVSQPHVYLQLEPFELGVEGEEVEHKGTCSCPFCGCADHMEGKSLGVCVHVHVCKWTEVREVRKLLAYYSWLP